MKPPRTKTQLFGYYLVTLRYPPQSYDRMITTMLDKLGYCRTCAQKTIEYFCTQEDEN